MMIMDQLIAFLSESLRIEGIHRAPTDLEINATVDFLALPHLSVEAVIALVAVYAPHAVIRDREGLDVRVGDHIPPPGDPSLPFALGTILMAINERLLSPFQGHCAYETLHPFTDGNGRSGRAIWLWQTRDASLGFLHRFYYQTLAEKR